MAQNKIFVLDTNIPLNDPKCGYNFQEHDIVIPIQVISEIDKFKKGSEFINFNAREFIRFLDEYSGDRIFNGGADLGEGLGKLRVVLAYEYHDKVRKNFPDENLIDNQLINTVFCISKLPENKGREVVFVSKDVGLRMKAKSLKIKTEDYKRELVPDVESLYKDVQNIEVDDNVIDCLYRSGKVELSSEKLYENEFVNLYCGNKKALARYAKGFLNYIKKEELEVFGITPKNSEQALAISGLMNPKIELVTIAGKAGTGKTLITVAAALEQILEKDSLKDKIYYTRQTISVGNREIGFLPGDVDEKLLPFMQALYDNLDVIGTIKNKQTKIDNMLKSGKIIIEPLSLIRGRSLVNAFFIVDEAQNLTAQEIKTIVTRAGQNTKMIFIGDITQIDHPYLDVGSNGLSYLIEKMKGQEFYAHVNLKKGERSRLAEISSNILY